MYKRILLKLSGEALAGEDKTGINQDVVDRVCDSIKKVYDMGVKIGIVVGGGNFWRGKYAPNMAKASADYMGMLATVMNSLAIQDALEKRGLDARVLTSIEMTELAEPYIVKKALKYLDEGKILVFGGGTGHPYFSTDTAAALRAAEIQAEVILVAKTVDGVYTADPKEDPNATKIDEISYQEILEKNLKVMDSTSVALCKDNNIPLLVFGMKEPDNIIKAVNGEKLGTYIS